MDLIDKLNDLANRIARQKETVLTEEAAKTAFVLPFIQSLGYDVFNPSEVVPEFIADHGVKKGEKVDYAIKQDDKITILIECKTIGSNLSTKVAGQLFRYFSVTEARFAVLTDGIRYQFYSDLEKENKMDDRPFFEFDLVQFNESQVDELKKFTKSTFDLDTIISTASNLKYHRALIAEIRSEFDSPSDDLVKLLTGRVYSGRITQQVKDQFSDLCFKAMRDYVKGQVNERLKSALNSDSEDEEVEVDESSGIKDDGIVTTKEEVAAHRIIQAIAAEVVDPERIHMRDAKSYCAILFDNNNRKPVCRLYFGKTRMSFGVFLPAGEINVPIEKVSEIYRNKNDILAAVNQYLD